MLEGSFLLKENVDKAKFLRETIFVFIVVSAWLVDFCVWW